MSIKPEIKERLALGPSEGEDMVLVTVMPGGSGIPQTSIAESYVKKEFGVQHKDIVSIEFAGRPDNGFGHVMLVTFKEKNDA